MRVAIEEARENSGARKIYQRGSGRDGEARPNRLDLTVFNQDHLIFGNSTALGIDKLTGFYCSNLSACEEWKCSEEYKRDDEKAKRRDGFHAG
jgi:hypothetical protein